MLVKWARRPARLYPIVIKGGVKMREVNREVGVIKVVSITENETVIKEVINSINEQKPNRFVAVDVALLGEQDKIIKHEHYEIEGEKYNLLMSESPSFAQGKPANEYRESDLWYIIDLIRAEQSQ